MADQFDPYHKWLGIPPEEQPPHHYRLLAVRLFETDPEVIEAAVEQRMAHLRHHQAGSYSGHSQRILNELATARLCLLVPEKRQVYDQALLAKLNAAGRWAVPMQPPPLPARMALVTPGFRSEMPDREGVALDFVGENESHLTINRRRHGSRSPVATMVGVSSLSLAVAAVAFFVQAARTKQHIAVDSAEPAEESLESVPQTAIQQPDEEMPPFPEVKPHPVTLPDPVPNPMSGFREWTRKLREGKRVRTPPASPITATKPEPKPTIPPPEKPASQVPPNEAPETVTESPPPQEQNRSLVGWISEAVKTRTLERSLTGGGASGGSPFADVPSAGALLVGFSVTLAEGEIITSIQPMFVNARGAGGVQGTRWGTERGRPVNLAARRGFAVAAVRVQGESSVQGFEVEFARITRTGLDADDTYTSPWVGTRSNQPLLTLGGDGLPVVGIFGRAGATVFSLGLVQLPAE